MSLLYIIVVNHRCMSQLYIIGHLEFPRDPLGRGSILDQWELSLSDGSQSLFSSDNVFATQLLPRHYARMVIVIIIVMIIYHDHDHYVQDH